MSQCGSCRRAAAALAFGLLVLAPAARAWNDTGHKVVARIAWKSMTPEARRGAVELLASAPGDADLAQLQPAWGGSADRLFFSRAATWPDRMRDREDRQRWERYHRGNWHYINYFWEPAADGRTAIERTDLKPQSTNAVERLQALAPALGDTSRPAEERAIQLAWVLHLVGDLHQPLHTSARVTPAAPEGDRGGNEFALAGDQDLHGYWDGLLSREYPRRFWHGEDGHLERVANRLRRLHPAASALDELSIREFDAWAREGFELSRSALYPPDLRQGQEPPDSYRSAARRIGERRAAIAGYRLADLLNRAFDPDAQEMR